MEEFVLYRHYARLFTKGAVINLVLVVTLIRSSMGRANKLLQSTNRIRVFLSDGERGEWGCGAGVWGGLVWAFG